MTIPSTRAVSIISNQNMEKSFLLNEGKHYRAQWYIHLITSIIGVGFNFIAIECFRLSPYYYGLRIRATIGFVLTGFLFFSYQIIKTSNNLIHNTFVGGDLACKFDAAINSTLILCVLMVTVTFSEVVRKDFTPNQRYRHKIIYVWSILWYNWSFICFIAQIVILS